MELSKSMQYYLAGGAAVIIVIALGWLLIARSHSSSAASETQTSIADLMATTSMESLIAMDQPAGDSVAVSDMHLSADSWVAVRDADGLRTLGAGWFPADATSGTVPLLRATEAGKQYEIVVYTDDGDKHFDMKADTLIDGAGTAFNAQ